MSKKEDPLLEHCYNNLQVYKLYYYEFRNIFKVSLKEFWENNLFGFDIIKFDEEFIQAKDGESISEKVKDKYGEKAEAIVRHLINPNRYKN